MTRREGLASFRAHMQRARVLLLCLVAALWLPATLHCSIEGFGVLPEPPGCCSDEASSSGDMDGCDTRCEFVMEGVQRAGDDALKAGPLFTEPWLRLSCVAMPRRGSEPADAPPETAAEWLRTWHFEDRAVAVPRAPAVV